MTTTTTRRGTRTPGTPERTQYDNARGATETIYLVALLSMPARDPRQALAMVIVEGVETLDTEPVRGLPDSERLAALDGFLDALAAIRAKQTDPTP